MESKSRCWAFFYLPGYQCALPTRWELGPFSPDYFQMAASTINSTLPLSGLRFLFLIKSYRKAFYSNDKVKFKGTVFCIFTLNCACSWSLKRVSQNESIPSQMLHLTDTQSNGVHKWCGYEIQINLSIWHVHVSWLDVISTPNKPSLVLHDPIMVPINIPTHSLNPVEPIDQADRKCRANKTRCCSCSPH